MGLARLTDFISHRFRSNSRHGVHSPFVYALIDECIYARSPQSPKKVTAYFESLKQDKTVVKGMDYGKDQEALESISYYAKRSAIPDFQADLLHRLVTYLKPKKVLELGTNLGKSLVSMASAVENSSFTGVEGNNSLAERARQSLVDLGLSNASIEQSSFDGFFEMNRKKYDLVFLDGDHRYEPTMRYFNEIKAVMEEGGAVVFHDIYWSKGMKRAWNEIKKDQDVTVTLDLFFFGIVWIGTPQAKEDFSIRFPSKLFLLAF